MKKFAFILAVLLLACCLTVTLVACGDDDKGIKQQEQNDYSKAEITSATNIVFDGTTGHYTVPNATKTYSFINEIEVSENATWQLSTDITAQNVVPSKTVSLEAGDNTFYILVTSGDGNNIGFYTVIIRRRPIYTVSFNSNGGASCENQYVEEDKCASAPTTTKTGYSFADWKWQDNEFDFSTPITTNMTLYAVWDLVDYNITYNLDGGTNNENNPSTYTIESSTITLATPTKTGYTFGGWYSESGFENEVTSIPKGSHVDKEFFAKWTPTVYTISYTLNGGSVDGTNPASYTIESNDITLVNPTRAYYTFIGWSGTDIEGESSSVKIAKCSYGNRNYTANWQAVEEMSNFEFTSTSTTCTITGIKDKTVKSIVVPDYVTNINEGAFSGCSSLESITLPFVGAKAGVTSSDTYQYPFGYIFGTSSYTGGTATTQYYYGSSTSDTTYDYYYIPSSLKSVTITGGNILSGAFVYCIGLTSVTIGNGVTSIGEGAFVYCIGLTSITISDSVTSIGDYAFDECRKLVEVWNKSNLTITAGSTGNGYVGYYALNVYTEEGGSKLTTDENGFVIYDGTTLVGYVGTATDITVPNTIQTIYQYAFCECIGLTSITIPDSVTSIGYGVFYDCSKLTSITFADTTTWYRTTSSTNWENKTGGTETDVTNALTNATNFTSTYYNCYWYK